MLHRGGHARLRGPTAFGRLRGECFLQAGTVVRRDLHHQLLSVNKGEKISEKQRPDSSTQPLQARWT